MKRKCYVERSEYINITVPQFKFPDMSDPMAGGFFHYILSWLPSLYPCVGGSAHRYLILLEYPQIQGKEPCHPIYILGWILKSEAMLVIYTLKVLFICNSLALAQNSSCPFHVYGVYWNYMYHINLYNLAVCCNYHHDRSSVLNVFITI